MRCYGPRRWKYIPNEEWAITGHAIVRGDPAFFFLAHMVTLFFFYIKKEPHKDKGGKLSLIHI